MSESNTGSALRETPWRPVVYLTILVVASGVALIALLIPTSFGSASLSLDVGDVAPQDLRAPTAVTYQSQVLTEAMREQAAEAVNPIYSPPDASIARRQVDRLRSVLNFITSVREDQFASTEQKLADLAALEDIQIGQETAEEILALNDSRWLVVQQEAVAVLEQIMRNTIREVQLEEARRSVPALVSLSLPEDQAMVVAELVSAFVAPNSLYNEELTEAARQQAREAVDPVNRSFVAGETIVERGSVITPEELEALERTGLLQSDNRWQDLASATTLVFLASGFVTFYLRFRPRLALEPRSLLLFTLLFLIFLIGARLTIPGHTVFPYLYPVAAFGLVLATLFGTQYGMVLSIPLSVLVSYGLPGAQTLTMYYLLGSVFGVLMLGRGKRVGAFIWSGAAVATTGAAVVIAYRLPDPTMDLVGLATLSGAGLLNGVASASLALLLQFFLAQLLGLTTALQLMDLSRPDQALLQFVLRNAPGTYQHSLQVSNLAEQAAERIEADALLTRVGALYHDCGKANHPHYFIENQVPGFPNPHDDLDPLESSQIIIRHVTDGLELARKHRLPTRIQDFIAEHHGTLVTGYQYAQAVKAAGGDESDVDPDRFRYPGPRPQSRETALVMLADGCEARVRAERPQTQEELRALVKSTIDARLTEGQLDDTSLTTRDLNEVVDVFTTTLRGVYHPRLQYPGSDRRTQPAPEVRYPEAPAAADTVTRAETGTSATR